MDLFGGELETEEPEIIIEESEEEQLGHPRTAKTCLGHEAIEQQLMEAWQGGRLPHGLIFSGPKGVGKATLAYSFIKQLLGNERLVASGAHPDLMSVERAYDPAKNTYKASVEVAEIRKVTPFLRKTASDGGWRVVIIDDADTMNRNAQNALLKILEEPPKNTLLILVTHRLGALIPTIRSRTQLIHFQPLAEEHMKELLSRSEHDIAQADLKTLMSFCGGSFGGAQDFLEQGGLETLRELLKALERYPEWDWPSLYVLSDSLGRVGKNQAYDHFRTLVIWLFSELATAKARGQDLAHLPFQLNSLETLLKESSLEHLLNICENLQDHFNKVEAANLDKRQAVLSAFSLITT